MNDNTRNDVGSNDEIQQTYLLMPYNLYVWLRKEFVVICKDDGEALIMRLIEYEIEADRRIWLREAEQCQESGKEIPEEPEWWVTLSHKQIISRLYDETIKDEKTLRIKLTSLTQSKKYLITRPHPDNPYGPPQYTINRDLVQKKLNALPKMGGPKNGRGDLPKMGGGTSQKWEGGPPKNGRGGPPKNGTPYKKEEEEKEFEEREKESVAPTLSNGESPSLSLSPSKSFSLSSSPEENISSEDQGSYSQERDDESLSSEKEKLREKKDILLGYWFMISHKDLSKDAKAQAHAETMVREGIATFDQLKTLYDMAFKQIEDQARAEGRDLVPPFLGNLIKQIPAYKASKSHQNALEQKRHFTQGTGHTKPPEADKAPKQPLEYLSAEDARRLNSIVVGRGSKDAIAREIRQKAERNRINLGDFGEVGQRARQLAGDLQEGEE